MMAQQIKQGLLWIGVNDPDSRDFHGISTTRGGSYNSFLIMDEKPAIIDGTNTKYYKQWLESLKQAVDPKKIGHMVVNHAEPDHVGALKEILKECSNARIVCNEKCREFLQSELGIEHDFLVVKDNDTLSLGSKTLRFIDAPMVHWPETMMTYLEEDKALFSGDLFATEICHEALFADEMKDFSILTRDYFADVMRPFKAAVKRAIEKARKLEIALLLPSHGPVYRKDIHAIIDKYDWYAGIPEEDKVLIIYSSIWKGTRKMANEIAQGVISAGFDARMYDIADTNFVTMMAEAMTSKAIALGSLTLVGRYHPLFETLFVFLKMNNQAGKKAAVFGTHGWGPASVPQLKKRLDELGYNVIDSVDLRWGPKTEEHNKMLRDLGKRLCEVS